MKNFFIIASETKGDKERKILSVEERLAKSLRKHEGVKVEFHSGHIDRGFRVPSDTECVITIGGDGTMLRASRAAYGIGVVFVGINRGHVGYLTEITDISDTDMKDYDRVTKRLAEGDFRVEERMMLKAQLFRDGAKIHEDFALNDVLLGKNDSIRMINFDVYVNDTLVNTYKADGFVVSSPTGSTGYSMSAGGPIANPADRLLILTPICPHSINTRAMVISPDSVVRLAAASPEQLFSCDGADGTPMENGDHLVVTRSEMTMKFVKFAETSFLDTLRNRMNPV